MHDRVTALLAAGALAFHFGANELQAAPPASLQQRQIPAHLQPGVALLNQQQFEQALAAFEVILQGDPEDGLAWYYFGLAHHSLGQLDEAIRAHFTASLALPSGHPVHVNATYNMACAYALKKRPERALLWLHRARNAGFSNFALLRTDADLRSLAGDPRFEALSAGGPPSKPAEDSAAVTSVTEVLPGGTGGVTLGVDGDLYVATFGADVWRVREDGSWEVFATGFTKSADCTFDAEGNLLQVDHTTSKIWSVAPDGTRSDLEIEGLNAPVGIDTGDDGSLYITNFRDDEILRVGPDGESTVLAANGLLNGPNGIVHAGDEGLFVVNYKDGVVLHLDPDDGVLRFLCELPGGGLGHVVWTGTDLIVTARTGNQVFRVTTDGVSTLLAGTGQKAIVDGGAVTSQFSLPNGIALSPDGSTLFVNDRLPGNRSVVRRVDLKPQ